MSQMGVSEVGRLKRHNVLFTLLHHLYFWLSLVPGSDPFLTSDQAHPLAVGAPACHPGAASSLAAAAAALCTASAAAGAGARATATPPTGATAAVHRGTQSLGATVAAGAAVR